MNDTETLFCPYCGQQCEVPIDVSAGSCSFTTDCEVCCRPFEVRVTVRAESVEEVSVHA